MNGQVFTLAEFLTPHDYQPPGLHQEIVVHGHCNQKAIISLDAEKKLFEAMGAHAAILDDGCCGMAGSFGFEPHKYDLSMKVYEHQLGPHLREVPAERPVLADGFSCKTQIEQTTGRRPLHLAQLPKRAKRGDPLDGRDDVDLKPNSGAVVIRAAFVLGVVIVGLGAFFMGRRLFR